MRLFRRSSVLQSAHPRRAGGDLRRDPRRGYQDRFAHSRRLPHFAGAGSPAYRPRTATASHPRPHLWWRRLLARTCFDQELCRLPSALVHYWVMHGGECSIKTPLRLLCAPVVLSRLRRPRPKSSSCAERALAASSWLWQSRANASEHAQIPQILNPLTADLAPPHRRAAAVSIVVSGLVTGMMFGRLMAGILTHFTGDTSNVFFLAAGCQYFVLAGM